MRDELRNGLPPLGRYYVETWGCQMNVLDSDKLSGALEHDGYARTEDARDADIIVLNTCSIREKASEKVFSHLGRLRSFKLARPDVVIGLCGCVAQQEGASVFDRAPHVDFVVGPRATASLPALIGRLRAGDESARHSVDLEYRDDSITFPFDRIRRDGIGAGKAFVTVIEGCNHRCSFCVVPRTRGREICRPLGDILEEVRHLVRQGVKEIEFLGQTVNAYRDEEGNTLPELLRQASKVELLRRIRFTTSHPAQMTESLMDAMGELAGVVCPFLHLPVQSGSDRVLQDMRRGYDRRSYLRKAEALRQRVPEICFGTDLIVGYPTEAEADFEDTLSLLDEVAFDTVYSFVYSARPGTAAAALSDPVPECEKMDRLSRLQARQRAIQEVRNAAWVGRVVEVLVEGESKRDASVWAGRSPEGKIVHFRGDSHPGSLMAVRIVEATPHSLRGRLVSAVA